jgi:hypothetical protein
MAKLACIAVIETTNDAIITNMDVFTNDLEGAGEAEALFKQRASMRGCDVNSMDDLLAQGYSEAEGYIVTILPL